MNTQITLVLDVRTLRVVFFTAADPGTIPADSRNLVASVPSTDVPAQMTLLNCYSYRWVGGKIINPPLAAAGRPLTTLVQNNRAALAKALHERLQTLWNEVPAWHAQSRQESRSIVFSTLSQAMSERIASAATDAEFTGLASEIALLSV
jgi:hypothetical protein